MNIKKIAIGTIAVAVAWFVMDFVIHGMLLAGVYQETAHLWRPMEEVKHVASTLTYLFAAAAFVMIYDMLREKSMMAGVKYGLIFGIGVGVSMGYGTYAYMPIPYMLALSWFLATVVESVVAGLITAAFVKD